MSRVLLVDPSLFTAPYDAALTRGLQSAGLTPLWAVRPLRPGDSPEIEQALCLPFFYRSSDKKEGSEIWRKIKKGFEHALGLRELMRVASALAPRLIHFQWTVIPAFDTACILALRRRFPIVVTVHDAVPYNGEKMPFLQRFAVDAPLRFADRVIVHTRSAQELVARRGVPLEKIAIVPHGPLRLAHEPKEPLPERTDARYTFVTFGEMKPYKGIDVLLEAVAALPEAVRQRARFVIAGRPRLDLSALERRVRELAIEDAIEFIPRRLADEEIFSLFHSADSFVFPYRQIDASGVYFLSQSMPKWTIASQVGIFAEDLDEGHSGRLVPPGDAEALAAALSEAIEERPAVPVAARDLEWRSIGKRTLRVYREAEAEFLRRTTEPSLEEETNELPEPEEPAERVSVERIRESAQGRAHRTSGVFRSIEPRRSDELT